MANTFSRAGVGTLFPASTCTENTGTEPSCPALALARVTASNLGKFTKGNAIYIGVPTL